MTPLMSDELDINVELLFKFEKRHLFPSFAWRSGVDLEQPCKLTSVSTPPNGMTSTFLEAALTVERIYVEKISPALQAIIMRLKVPRRYELFKATGWETDDEEEDERINVSPCSLRRG